jgi:monofunctional biosynthetic peptidoglycan transglycosylase
MVCVLGFSLWLWWSLPSVDALAKKNPETTAFIELRKQQAKESGESFRLRWKWRRLPRISRYLQHAVVAAEDAKFWQHEGVDWDAIEDAAEEAWETKSMARGGSTITQQLAKNLYLSPSKNPVRKLREFFIARRLEEALDKKRILELYLNVAEWGPGVFGAEAAARKWYRRSAAELTPSQAARLAVALPNPFKRHPKKKAAWLDRKARRLVRSMRRSRLLTKEQYEQAIAELSPAKGDKSSD